MVVRLRTIGIAVGRTASRVLRWPFWWPLCSLLFVFSGTETQALTLENFVWSTNSAANPAAGLVQGIDGNFYGTSFAGGSYGLGAIYQVTPAGAFQVLISFDGTNGANPRGALISDQTGNLFGTTSTGGSAGAGVVFKYSPGEGITVLHDFAGGQAGNPYAGLVRASDGNFYGTTENGGAIFQITPSGSFSNVSTFFGEIGTSLNYTLTQTSDGALLGAAGIKASFDSSVLGSYGAPSNSPDGCILFQVSTNGGIVTPLMQLSGLQGSQPIGGFVQAGDGRFYGTTSSGGLHGMGTVFRFSRTAGMTLSNPPSGLPGGIIFTKLYDFDGPSGAFPYGPLSLGADGRIYGTTFAGGANGKGVIFALSTSGAYSLLSSFSGTNGAQPQGTLLLAADGYLYGTTRSGGTYGLGCVFRTDINGAITPLVSFPPAFISPKFLGNLVRGADGNFYTVVSNTGASSLTLLQVSPSGSFSNFASLANTSHPLVPSESLGQSAEGVFYGTTYSGGVFGAGTVFKVMSDGNAATLFDFDFTNGNHPWSAPIQASNSLLYGGTAEGGDGYGTLYCLTTNGSLVFSTNFEGADGQGPMAPLMEGPDGALYGTTYSGGASNYGSVFRLTPDGTSTSLVSFNFTNGAYPLGGLVQGPDGFLYGSTWGGGIIAPLYPSGMGTIFKMSTNGDLTTLAFGDLTNGAAPQGTLIFGPDGNLYGTTYRAGRSNQGSVFRVSTSGGIEAVYSFSGTDGAHLNAGLVLGSDGALYGSTSAGGPGGNGSLFRLTEPAVLQAGIDGDVAQIAWPAFDAGYHLEFTLNLLDTNSWQAVPEARFTNNNQILVQQPMSTNSNFYRLKKP